MLTPQLLATLPDDHLVTALRAEFDPLTSTPAEQELIKRMEKLLDERVDTSPITDLMTEYEVTDAEIKAVIESHPASLKDMASMLSLLNDEGIEDPEQLKKAIGLLQQFEAIANDAGDAITRLSQLITTAQE